MIIRRNVPGDRMFFIDHGQAVMETESEERELCDGDFFGGQSNLHSSDRGVPGASVKILLLLTMKASWGSFRTVISLSAVSKPFCSLLLASWYIERKIKLQINNAKNGIAREVSLSSQLIH